MVRGEGIESLGPISLGCTIELPKLKSERCLVCGVSSIDPLAPMYNCVNECKFIVHKNCLEAHAKAVGADMYDRSLFVCNDGRFQFRRTEILLYSALDQSSVKQLIIISNKRGFVDSAKYSNQCKRWENEEIQCEHCRVWYDMYGRDHIARFCCKAAGEPITERNMNYPFACIKRFKHVNWKVP